MKNPHLQLKEAIFEINKTAYETDDFFKECEAKLEEYARIRVDFVEQVKFALPHQKEHLQSQLDAFDRKVEKSKAELRDYLKACLEEDGCVKIESPDQEKLDAAFAKADVAHARIYIVYKHLQPHLLEEFTRIVTDHLPPDEVELFFERVARHEADELNEILTSVESDGNALEP